jgi:hypothetical protein
MQFLGTLDQKIAQFTIAALTDGLAEGSLFDLSPNRECFPGMCTELALTTFLSLATYTARIGN